MGTNNIYRFFFEKMILGDFENPGTVELSDDLKKLQRELDIDDDFVEASNHGRCRCKKYLVWRVRCGPEDKGSTNP